MAVGSAMAYSERNDEQGDASFDSFVETEPLVPAVELEVLVRAPLVFVTVEEA